MFKGVVDRESGDGGRERGSEDRVKVFQKREMHCTRTQKMKARNEVLFQYILFSRRRISHEPVCGMPLPPIPSFLSSSLQSEITRRISQMKGIFVIHQKNVMAG